MFDMRSYIVSLIAVFMALGIGILLGTVIVDNGILVDQQNAFLKKIGDQMRELREENKDLQSRLDISERFMPEAAGFITKDRLIGKRVAIFCTAKVDEQVRKSVAQTIAGAGGESILYTINIADIGAADAGTKKKLRDLFEVDQVSDMQLEAIIVQNFAEDIAAWQDLSRLVALADNGWLTIIGSFAEAPNAAVIIGEALPENSKVFDRMHKPIIEVMEHSQIPTIAVETWDSRLTTIGKFKKAGVSATIDNVDLTPGQISLVLALTGEYGDYGVKKTADSLVPEIKGASANTGPVEQSDP